MENFLQEELKNLKQLKFNQTSYQNSYYFDNKLEKIFKNEFLNLQFKCELELQEKKS